MKITNKLIKDLEAEKTIYRYSEDGCWQDIEADSFDDALEKGQEILEAGWKHEKAEKTFWVSATVSEIAFTEEGEEDTVQSGEITAEIDPDEPDCLPDQDHVWRSPFSVVGGCKSNPGVWGHGGGVVINSCCVRCGCRRQSDTWAQNPQTGEQGLSSLSYESGFYVERLNQNMIDEHKRNLRIAQKVLDFYNTTAEINEGEGECPCIVLYADGTFDISNAVNYDAPYLIVRTEDTFDAELDTAEKVLLWMEDLAKEKRNETK